MLEGRNLKLIDFSYQSEKAVFQKRNKNSQGCTFIDFSLSKVSIK